MLYNLMENNHRLHTAGKITIFTAFSGLLIFAFIFLFNAGKTELMKVEAQSATTTLTVLNTPPVWIVMAHEEFESSTTSPTNSGNEISWVAVADNSGAAPYFLIVCSGSATPTPNAAASLLDLGTAPPDCISGVQWGVSTATAVMTQARVATTTTESFAEINDWYAWVCDDDPVNPRCNNVTSQGLNATNSSPFHVNYRPVFSAFSNNSPTDPGDVVTFYSTSSDPNVVRGPDAIYLFVCNENDFDAGAFDCGPGGTIASTTGTVYDDASASFTLPSVIQDDIYDAYGFIIDEYGHTAVGGAQGTNVGFTVSNVPPTVAAGDISINGGLDMVLTQVASQTPGFTLDFIVSDANSCENSMGGDEIVDYVVALHRSGVGTTTCDGSAGSYDPNNCYPSGVGMAMWELNCTASSTSCTGPTDPTMSFSCEFPLWYIADPTDASSPFSLENWTVAIAGVDDNNATGTLTISSNVVDLLSFPAIDLITGEIPYGALEPGDDTGILNATTTILSVGNTGLNQNIQGDSMCTTYSVGSPCLPSASSTIPDFMQEFATSSISYGSGIAMSSTTPQLLELKVPKTIATTTPSQGVTYWGIGVPATITLSGAYTGLNTFYAVTSSSTDW